MQRPDQPPSRLQHPRKPHHPASVRVSELVAPRAPTLATRMSPERVIRSRRPPRRGAPERPADAASRRSATSSAALRRAAIAIAAKPPRGDSRAGRADRPPRPGPSHGRSRRSGSDQALVRSLIGERLHGADGRSSGVRGRDQQRFVIRRIGRIMNRCRRRTFRSDVFPARYGQMIAGTLAARRIVQTTRVSGDTSASPAAG
jgi:hypothetical protein